MAHGSSYPLYPDYNPNPPSYSNPYQTQSPPSYSNPYQTQSPPPYQYPSQQNVSSRRQSSQESDWSLSCGNDCKNQMACLIIGVALAAIAAVATYFCITRGLPLYDAATSSLELFGAGFMIYSGVVFSVVAVGNALYAGGKLLCHTQGSRFDYTPTDAKIQIGVSILAPIAAIPAVIVGGLCCLKG